MASVMLSKIASLRLCSSSKNSIRARISDMSVLHSGWSSTGRLSWPSPSNIHTRPPCLVYGMVPRFTRERIASTLTPNSSAAWPTLSRRLVSRLGSSPTPLC
jgi:hypothetical protein